MTKHIMNQASQMMADLKQGQKLMYPTLMTLPEIHGFYQPLAPKQKVAVISGGGSGHEPADVGYVGTGMLNAAIMGDLLTPPRSQAIVALAKQVASEQQVLLIVKNFPADRQVFEQAAQSLIASGYQVAQVIVTDDVSVDPSTFKQRQRGVAGTVLLQKILGHSAEQGASLAELAQLGQQLNRRLKTLGVALSPADVPGNQGPSFTLAPDQIYYGIGIHGEPGYRQVQLPTSELLANELVNKLVPQLKVEQQNVAVLVNGLGGTPLSELAIFAQDVQQLLRLKGLQSAFLKVGNYMTAYNMQGLSLSLLTLASPTWLTALQAPSHAASW